MFRRKKRDDDDLEDYALSPEDQALEDAELLALIDAQQTDEDVDDGAGPSRPTGP